MQKAAAYKAASDIEAANLHDTVAEAILASGCLGGSDGSSGEEGSRTTLGGKKAPKLPDEELQLIAATLASEINDKQLVILDVLGRGGFGTVRGRFCGSWICSLLPESCRPKLPCSLPSPRFTVACGRG